MRNQNENPCNHWALWQCYSVPITDRDRLCTLKQEVFPSQEQNLMQKGMKRLHTRNPSSLFVLHSCFRYREQYIFCNDQSTKVEIPLQELSVLYFLPGNQIRLLLLYLSTAALIRKEIFQLPDEEVNSCHIRSPSKHHNLHPVPVSKSHTRTSSIGKQAMGAKQSFSFYFWQALKIPAAPNAQAHLLSREEDDNYCSGPLAVWGCLLRLEQIVVN